MADRGELVVSATPTVPVAVGGSSEQATSMDFNPVSFFSVPIRTDNVSDGGKLPFRRDVQGSDMKSKAMEFFRNIMGCQGPRIDELPTNERHADELWVGINELLIDMSSHIDGLSLHGLRIGEFPLDDGFALVDGLAHDDGLAVDDELTLDDGRPLDGRPLDVHIAIGVHGCEEKLDSIGARIEQLVPRIRARYFDWVALLTILVGLFEGMAALLNFFSTS